MQTVNPAMPATLLQTGIYTIPEASRLTQVSPWRIRRWLKGYEFASGTGRHRSPPIWQGEIDPIDRCMALGFRDLLEIRAVDAFLKAGVPWKTLRMAHHNAKERLGHPHPFCSSRFETNGKAIFLELPESEGGLLDIARLQQVFDVVIKPTLTNLDFGQGDMADRWWPSGRDHFVALDPKRNFGQPSIFERGIPTRVLANSVHANESIELVARWYETSVEEVQEAVVFEQRLAA